MRTVRPCIDCGKLTTRSRCPEHERARAHDRSDREPWRAVYRDPRWQGAQRACISRAGGRCQGTWDGVRCNQTHDLQAHHTVPLRRLWLAGKAGQAFDVEMLAALCPRCHAAAERALRNHPNG